MFMNQAAQLRHRIREGHIFCGRGILKKRKFGFLILCLGVSLLVTGMFVYLGGPSTGETEDFVVSEGQETVRIYGGKSWELPFDMNRTKLPMILSLALNASIQVESGVVDVRIMDSSFHEIWEVDRSQGDGLEYIGVRQLDIHFLDVENNTFYLVLDNRQYSTAKNVTISYARIAAIRFYDFSRPFTGLALAGFGLFLIVVTTALGNPLNHILQAVLVRYRLLLGAGSIESLEETVTVVRFSSRFIWLGLAVPISILTLGWVWGIEQINGSQIARVPEANWLLSISYDLWTRFIMIFLPVILLGITSYFVVVVLIGYATEILTSRMLKQKPKSELNLLTLKYFWRSWLHQDSVLALVVGVTSTVLAFTQPQPIRSVLLLLAVSVFALAVGHNGYLSFETACKRLKLRPASEFRSRRILSQISLTSGAWQGVLALFTIRWAYSVSLNPVVEYLIKADYIAKLPVNLTHSLFKTMIDDLLGLLSMINSEYSVFLVTLFAFMGIVYAYLMPNLFTVRLRRKFIRRALSATIIFVSTFVSQLSLSILMPQYVSSDFSLLAVMSIVVAIVAQFMQRTYEEFLGKH